MRQSADRRHLCRRYYSGSRSDHILLPRQSIARVRKQQHESIRTNLYALRSRVSERTSLPLNGDLKGNSRGESWSFWFWTYLPREVPTREPTARGAAGNCERSFGPTRPITQYSSTCHVGGHQNSCVHCRSLGIDAGRCFRNYRLLLRNRNRGCQGKSPPNHSTRPSHKPCIALRAIKHRGPIERR